VPFHNYSAGKVTGNAWTFGDAGTSTLQNPSHTYAAAGTYYPQLTVCNYAGGDCTSHPGNADAYALPSPGLQVLPELEVTDTLKISKTGTPGQIALSWTDVTGEDGYRVWESNTPSAKRSSAGSTVADVHSFTFIPAADGKYFRIQPLSSAYVCGDGIIGGNW
jgi:PKD repeat protein